MANLSLGKLRGLSAAANPAGMFTILALDHGASFKKIFWADAKNVRDSDIVERKLDILHVLAPHASAVLLDVQYALAPAILKRVLPGHVGLLVNVENEDYASPSNTHPSQLLEGWSVGKIKRVGANGVKFFFYYMPDAGEFTRTQEELVRRLADECQEYDLPFFAEPISYGIQSSERRRIVVETARRISRLGIDVLKAEFPIDVSTERDEKVWGDACRELSGACSVPWTLLSAGVDYETFTRQVQIACQSGASGFVAGRAVWQESAGLTDSARQKYIEQIAVVRLEQLARIANANARPWSDFADPLPILHQDWYKDYGGLMATRK